MTYTRLTIHVSPEMHEDLSQRAAAKGLSITDLIRRSIALESFLWEHQQTGAEILIRNGDTVRKVMPR
jgi:Ribbon-helix-helix protein, copG family